MTVNPILTGEAYLRQPTFPQTFLVDQLLPVGGSMMIYGDPKVGKSFLALQLVFHLATGTPFLGFNVPNAVKVAYVQLDNPRSLWMERLNDLREAGHPVDHPNIWYGDRDSLDTWPFDVMRPDHCELLRNALRTITPDVVIIDTLKESNTADENDATAMQKAVALLTEMTRPAALVVVHHGRKPNADRPESIVSGSRGSSYLTGKMDAVIHCSKKAIHYTGRAIEEGSLKVARADDYTWILAQADVDAAIATTIREGGTLGEMARKLAFRLGGDKTESACKSLLRRRMKSTSGHPSPSSSADATSGGRPTAATENATASSPSNPGIAAKTPSGE